MNRRRFLETSILSSFVLGSDPTDLYAAISALQEENAQAKPLQIKQVFNLSEHYDPEVAKKAYLDRKPEGALFAPPPAAPQHRILFYDVDKKEFLPPALLKGHSALQNQTGTYTMETYLRRYHTSAALDAPLRRQFKAGSLQLQLGTTNVKSDGSNDLTWLLITGLVLPQTRGQSVLNDNNPTSKFSDKIEIKDGVMGFSVSLWGQRQEGGWFKWLKWIAGVLKTSSSFALFGVVPIPALPQQALAITNNVLNYLESREQLYEIWNSLQGRYAILNSVADGKVEGYLPEGTYVLLDPEYYDQHRDIPNRKFLVGHTVDIDSGAYTLLDQKNKEPDVADYLAVRLTYQKKVS